MKAACFTVAVLDTFPGRKDSWPGGNALNQTFGFRRVGLESAFIGALGTDDAGDRLAALLKAENVDSSHARQVDGNTASNRIINDENGERFGEEGAWQGGVYQDFHLSEDDWLFAAGADIWATHFDCPDFREALKRKTDRQFLAVDMLHLMDEPLLEDCIGIVDVAYIGGDSGMADTLEALSRRTSEAEGRATVFILTLGSRGSMAFSDGERILQPALPLERVVDTTGCGDAFQAACTTVLASGGSIEDALAAGAAAGRKAAMRYGGSPWRDGAA